MYDTYSKSPLLQTPLLWTAAYYGQQQNPRSVTFFNSVIKTPLLWTLLILPQSPILTLPPVVAFLNTPNFGNVGGPLTSFSKIECSYLLNIKYHTWAL